MTQTPSGGLAAPDLAGLPNLPVPPAPAPGDLRDLATAHGLTVSGRRPSLVAYSRQVWARRQFISAFASARLTTQHSQARLGQLWQVLTPLLNAVVYYFVFGILLGTSRGIPNFVPFLVTGVFIWTFTANAVSSGARAVSGNLGLIRALHFPRASLPLAITLQQLQQTLYAMGALVVILLVFGQYPRWSWLLVIPALLLQGVFNTGLALIVARLGSRTPDVATLVPFVMRVWMYVSGVMWSIDRLAGHGRMPHEVYVALKVNPPAVYIDLARFALIDTFTSDQLPRHVWAIALGWAVVVGFLGFVFFWRAEEKYGRG
ncbi:ABC-2 type transporter [Nostocoides japonicum T1-X7]|uniref:Transport permease protein n=1 Tax=Nostocoides japonicum T1-X7 TaxID=1194083 RepID=A0A077M389_9MICO|nr:ABC transporter permease [Tetrasphaera japonica]CCH80211.1 ABC-2 type transporter [Tetrasphaera japonica T1-X7]